MVDDLLVRMDLGRLFSPFVERVRNMLMACREDGFDYWAISGYRSPEEQQVLFNQGRTVTHDSRGNHLRIVTDAKPWFSVHQYGLAIDFSRDADVSRGGLQPSWGVSDYDELGRQAVRQGLVWGGSFGIKDRPHVQWPGFVTGREIEPLRAILQPEKNLSQGLQKVWRYVAAMELAA